MVKKLKKTPIIRYDGEFPVIKVERCPDWDYERVKTVRFWCEYCRKYHIHGALGGELEHPGHRGAHCINQDSPFKEHGYILEWNKIAEQLPS